MALLFKMVGIFGIGAAVFGLSYQYNKRFLDWLRFQSLGTRDYIVEKLGVMFIDMPPQKILIWLFCMSFGLGGLVFLLFLPNLFPAIPFAIMATLLGWKAPKPLVNMYYRRRVRTFEYQMIDGLSLMSNGLKSGLSIVQSIGMVAQEMPNPMQQEFNLILSQNKLGVSLEEAFTNLAKRIESDDVEMFVTSINILKETGGNLAETFDTIVTTIRERLKVESKIRALTTQGLLQGITLMCVPPVLGFILYVSDPEFMAPMFTSVVGWLIVMVIMILEAVGYFVIMNIVKIEV